MRQKTVPKTKAQKELSALPVSDYCAARILDDLRQITNQENVNYLSNKFGMFTSSSIFLACAITEYRESLQSFLVDRFDSGDALLGLS